MRMRRKPWARPELAACPFYHCAETADPTASRGVWRSLYKNPDAPLWLELGCGKGAFVAAAAVRWPQINLLAVDIKSEVLVLAKRAVETAFANADRDIDNVRLAAQEIALIDHMLAESDTVQRIFIHFCNPWPKGYHHKRRLTHPRQLVQYRTFLADGGVVSFKTDDDDLFDASLSYFADCGFAVTWQTRDLHAEPALPDETLGLVTEHEARFSAQGIPIKALLAVKLPSLPDNEATRDALQSLTGHTQAAQPTP